MPGEHLARLERQRPDRGVVERIGQLQLIGVPAAFDLLLLLVEANLKQRVATLKILKTTPCLTLTSGRFCGFSFSD